MKGLSGWLCILAGLGLAYTYVGYPLLVALCARFWPRPVRRGAGERRCAIVISAHNEAARLPAKIRSLQLMAGWERVDAVWIGSDGSTDDTAAVLAAINEPRLRVLIFPQRRGKPAVLNDLLAQVDSEIVVFTDARQELEAVALRTLLAGFDDPTVGVVSGELVFRAPRVDQSEAGGVRGYWNYEKWIRRQESAFRSVPGATGALYAIRRALVEPLVPDTILDDVVLPMRAVHRGYRCVFESGAVAYDVPSPTRAGEAARKRRTLAGVLQVLRLEPWVLSPFRNPIWWEFFSHKVMRMILPIFFIVLLVASWWGREASPLAVLFWAQAVGWLLAILGGVVEGWRGRVSGLSLLWMLLVMNWMTILAWWDAFRGRWMVTWRRTS